MHDPIPDANGAALLKKKERVYGRNYVSILADGFFFTFATTMFSTENVLPVYIAHISDKAVYIALLSAMHYGLTYLASIFACLLGTNTRSPKWMSVGICGLQRVGFLLIFFSTFLVGKNDSLALTVFFISFAAFAVSAGMSAPLFSQMVSVSIHRNIGSFFGMYSVAGAVGGLAASTIFAYISTKYVFPVGFRYVFLLGVAFALCSTASIAFGVKEVLDDRVVEKISLRDIPPICVDIIKTNRSFRYFTIVRVLVGAAEFTVPYYILHAARLPGVPASFVGTMTIVFLTSKIFGSMAAGWLADKFGSSVTLRTSCLCCAIAAVLAITLADHRVAYVMYALLAMGTNGVYVVGSTSVIEYSHNYRTTFYSAVVGICCAPIAVVTAFCGAAIANAFSFRTLFIIALAVYAVCLVLSVTLQKRDERLRRGEKKW